jgi:hypothetical protein
LLFVILFLQLILVQDLFEQSSGLPNPIKYASGIDIVRQRWAKFDIS